VNPPQAGSKAVAMDLAPGDGQFVGVCNTGYRDKFAAEKAHYEMAIAARPGQSRPVVRVLTDPKGTVGFLGGGHAAIPLLP